MTIQEILKSYPKQRPPLSEKFQSIYTEVYKQSRNGRSILYAITQWLESWGHKKVAKSSKEGLSTLEIGAGTLNQLPYEAPTDSYDIIEPFRELFEEKTDLLPRIRSIYGDISEIPPETKYDRITSVGVMEHVLNLPALIARSGVLLEKNGVFCACFPAGFLFDFAWKISVGLSFRLRTGMDYGELMRHEHVNDPREIIAIIKYFFNDVSVRRYPLGLHHASLYTFVSAKEPNFDRCREYLDSNADRK